MKGSLTMSSSSSGRSSAATNMDTRDSCYFPGCRKDANCNCDICVDSFNATRDLMTNSIQKSSLTSKFTSPRRPRLEITPLAFDTTIVSTPISRSCEKIATPQLNSMKKLSLEEKKETRKKQRRYGDVLLNMGCLVGLIFVVEFGLSFGVSWVSKPVFSFDDVRNIGERSWAVKDFNWRLKFLQKELTNFVGDGNVSNCSHSDSKWEINQDGQPLNSRCVLYKSAMEEVSIWGWPLQTSGLLKAGLHSRSFTLLSGRVTEWSDGKIGYSIRKANSSWILRKRGASVVELDRETWVLEYGRSCMLDNPRFLSAVVEIVKHRVSRKMTSWFSIEDQSWKLTSKVNMMYPT